MVIYAINKTPQSGVNHNIKKFSAWNSLVFQDSSLWIMESSVNTWTKSFISFIWLMHFKQAPSNSFLPAYKNTNLLDVGLLKFLKSPTCDNKIEPLNSDEYPSYYAWYDALLQPKE